MTDRAVGDALRSTDTLVVVEAPAGCGKTFQAASFAVDVASSLGRGRVLVLTHTHAAREVFAERARSATSIEPRTIDSLVVQLARIYHRALHLPFDVSSWARSGVGDHSDLAVRVANLLDRTPPLRNLLAQRYPIVILDEHQDASEGQHRIALALHAGGAKLRVFGDPMQQIYDEDENAATARWNDLSNRADKKVELTFPHRWQTASAALGDWVLGARRSLMTNGTLELRRGLPDSLRIIHADNRLDGYNFHPPPAVIDAMRQLQRSKDRSLTLTYFTRNLPPLHSGVARSMPIWEGHTREALEALVKKLKSSDGNATKVCNALIQFTNVVASGFTASGFSKVLLREVANNCEKPGRGKSAKIQALARHILERPDHRGASAMLRELTSLAKEDAAFACVHFRHPAEMRDAIELGEHDDLATGLAVVAQRRTHRRPSLPRCAITSIHKSKGLETDHALVVPVDKANFPDTAMHRHLLYVAISRARSSLTLVVPPKNPSPLVSV